MFRSLEGKVAFVTGAARGQGRAHAVRLAELGAQLVLVDLAAPVPTVHYDGATREDLDRTVELIEREDVRALPFVGDVRDQAVLDEAVAAAVSEFGRIDVLVANAGIVTLGPVWEITDEQWDTMIGVNLTGVWRTVKAAVPTMIAGGNGGSIILTASTNGLKGGYNLGHYAAAKHGVVGLMRTLANELAQYDIRANALAPTNVGTTMILNPGTYQVFRPDLENPTQDDAREAFASYHLLKTPWIDVEDVANAVEYLATDLSRYVTGTVMEIDAGFGAKFPN